jgi:phenol 2-monooxygenase
LKARTLLLGDFLISSTSSAIIPEDAPQADYYLGVSRFGKALYDCDQSVAARYDFSAALGGIAVVRPDGMLGYSGELGDGKNLGDSFLRLVKASLDGLPKSIPDVAENKSKTTKDIEFDVDTTDYKQVANGVQF